MIAIIFEVIPADGQRQTYLDIAAEMRPLAEQIDGFISVERFQSLTNPDKMLSISFFRDEVAVERWRKLVAPRPRGAGVYSPITACALRMCCATMA